MRTMCVAGLTTVLVLAFGGGAAWASTTPVYYDVGMGDQALINNTGGDRNVALGSNALATLAIYNDNTAVGHDALKLARGARNIAIGSGAGSALTAGSDNIEIGNKGTGPDSRTIRIGTQGTQTAAYLAASPAPRSPGP